jgi:hypothetical protein
MDFLYPNLEVVKTKPVGVQFTRAKNVNMFHVKDEIKTIPVSYLNNTSTMSLSKRNNVSFYC